MQKLLIALLLAVSPDVALAQDVAPADRAEIHRVITAQIEAFRHDDGAAAFALAAPAIQEKFGDAAHFLSAVRQAYAPLYHPHSFSFGELTVDDGLTEQTMDVVGQDGVPAEAVYDLQHQPDGSWRISGCRLLKSAYQET